jgi:uncharacterized membrane protein YqjE
MSAQLIAALQRVAATSTEIAASRLELAAVELTQERLRLSRQIAAAAIALVALPFGSTLAAMALAWSLGPPAGAWLLGGVAMLWLTGGAIALVQCRRRARDGAPLLQHTLAQLREDAAALAAA